jgi:ubiquinone/menaquinone biosynthesis C-methylase UbiE
MIAKDLQRLERLYGADNMSWSADLWDISSPLICSIENELHKDLSCAIRNIKDRKNAKVLDIGCCWGKDLIKLVEFGFRPENLYGIDYLEEHVCEANKRYPQLKISRGDAGKMGYADASFDLIFQFVCFSSVFDGEIHKKMASEIHRTLKPGGIFLWYDGRKGTDYYTADNELCFKGISEEHVQKVLFPKFDLISKNDLCKKNISVIFKGIARISRFLLRHDICRSNLGSDIFNYLQMFPGKKSHVFMVFKKAYK